MRTILLTFSLLALANASHAATWDDAERASHCRQMAGKEVGEGEGKMASNRHIVQRFSDCMMGR